MNTISPEIWAYWGIASEISQLFVLHWDELFDSQTPDTWQVRTGSTRTVLEEIVEAIDLSMNHERHRHNLPYLFLEARAKISLDPIISKHFPAVTAYLEKADQFKKPTPSVPAETKD